ncbi:MAG: alkaline phosphatase [Blastopirellula sp.]|nr:MAG: alkaline phosphatase [Blastopirellula sp.]
MRSISLFSVSLLTILCICTSGQAADTTENDSADKTTKEAVVKLDTIKDLQKMAIEAGASEAAHWGWDKNLYTQWGSHSNRLIPVYTFGTKGSDKGVRLWDYAWKNSLYRSEANISRIYKKIPENTLNPEAQYLDQTNIYDLQLAALEAGKKHIFLVVFDGMDWQTTRAASIHNLQKVAYEKGRGTGTHFQDYTADGTSQFGYMVTSPHNEGSKTDVNKQTVLNPGGSRSGGYDVKLGGPTPWKAGSSDRYLIGKAIGDENVHAYTDSASSAASMMCGIKTYNNAINVDAEGTPIASIAHRAQAEGYAVGAVSSVPISHATPACAYAHNVHRNDYQDITRDLLGLPSIFHAATPLQGLDVLIGAGHGSIKEKDSAQGENFVAGNIYLTDDDLKSVNVANGGNYIVAQRTEGVSGSENLQAAAVKAAKQSKRLFGYYGVGSTKHLPFQTADGGYDPTNGRSKKSEKYTEADLHENPTLAEMTQAALTVIGQNPKGSWLLVESGDVDWANHDNNLDNSIGAVNSGDAAVKVITDWVEKNSNWSESVLIVTADHGHFLHLEKPEMLIADE